MKNMIKILDDGWAIDNWIGTSVEIRARKLISDSSRVFVEANVLKQIVRFYRVKSIIAYDKY
jgi:hypothetical protein